MTIFPLPQFEADLKHQQEADARAYAELNAPKTIVVRYGVMGMIGEFPYEGSAKPGCGSKIVVKTFRGTEIGEMLTSTCPNAGCGKSVSRKQMLDYIQASGGKHYPFSTRGKALRVATHDDMTDQSRIEQSRHELKMLGRKVCEQLGIETKIVDAEPIIGRELVTFYYGSEERLDTRDHERLVNTLTHELDGKHGSRVDLRQVGARDEARITADYERCGEYCCCKNFLKVLKPVQMRSAKIQKATLDPLKISGRCGRLMCCLRYEDQTYDELRKRLPNRKKRVGTPDGDGIVISSQILTQLVLVELDASRERIAVPVENITEPGQAVAPKPAPAAKPDTDQPKRRERRHEPRDTTQSNEQAISSEDHAQDAASETRSRKRRRRGKQGTQPSTSSDTPEVVAPGDHTASEKSTESRPTETPARRKRRRRRSRAAEELRQTSGNEQPDAPSVTDTPPPSTSHQQDTTSASEEQTASDTPSRSRRRRRRRRKPNSDGTGSLFEDTPPSDQE
ncbi:MAG: hypothetical protein H6815_02405 [Phycisphaeraceae bacterium]|nr:hypothetical protein [Phycisphaerales bacterium]MCB9859279.1 hypothetical protein [Phycisphaeraceae bacterium]